ncbi:hypothetical protein BJY52DRAFT_1227047 [Lactarius psammicola]|nr:hypothetical protein BJY52DRAFT_1227047 [Lactarius psammicola]
MPNDALRDLAAALVNVYKEGLERCGLGAELLALDNVGVDVRLRLWEDDSIMHVGSSMSVPMCAWMDMRDGEGIERVSTEEVQTHHILHCRLETGDGESESNRDGVDETSAMVDDTKWSKDGWGNRGIRDGTVSCDIEPLEERMEAFGGVECSVSNESFGCYAYLDDRFPVVTGHLVPRLETERSGVVSEVMKTPLRRVLVPNGNFMGVQSRTMKTMMGMIAPCGGVCNMLAKEHTHAKCGVRPVGDPGTVVAEHVLRQGQDKAQRCTKM